VTVWLSDAFLKHFLSTLLGITPSRFGYTNNTSSGIISLVGFGLFIGFVDVYQIQCRISPDVFHESQKQP